MCMSVCFLLLGIINYWKSQYASKKTLIDDSQKQLVTTPSHLLVLFEIVGILLLLAVVILSTELCGYYGRKSMVLVIYETLLHKISI